MIPQTAAGNISRIKGVVVTWQIGVLLIPPNSVPGNRSPIPKTEFVCVLAWYGEFSSFPGSQASNMKSMVWRVQ